MTIHVMLDLETWGTEPGNDLRSIGAVVFDPDSGMTALPDFVPEDTFYRAVDNPGRSLDESCYETSDGQVVHDAEYPFYDPTSDMFRRYNLQRDPRTVQWWSEQSDEAQAAFANPVDLREGLKRFDEWLTALAPRTTPDRQSPEIRLWSHGPAFDPPILAAAYKAVGLPVPWHYRAPRDTRTAFDLAGIDDHSAWLKAHPGPLGIPHHALDDAICQARATAAAMLYIKDCCFVRAEWDGIMGAQA